MKKHALAWGWIRVLAVLSIMAAPASGYQDQNIKEYPCMGSPDIVSLSPAFSHTDLEEKPGDEIRIAQYNIENFTDGVGDGGARTRERVQRHARLAAAIIDQMTPDILIVIEIENATALNILNDALKHPFAYGYISKFGRPGENKLNIAVLSRFPLTNVTEMDFLAMQGSGRPPRGTVRFELPLSDHDRLLVYGVHLKSNFGRRAKNIAKRRNGLIQVVKDAKQVMAAAPDMQWEAVILGDMNADPEGRSFRGAPSLEPLSGWISMWEGVPLRDRATCPTRYGDPHLEFDPVTFDRVYVNPALTQAPWVAQRPVRIPEGVVPKQSVAPGGPEGHVSDHYPVYMDIEREMQPVELKKIPLPDE